MMLVQSRGISSLIHLMLMVVLSDRNAFIIQACRFKGGTGIIISNPFTTINFQLYQLATQIEEPRECDWLNLQKDINCKHLNASE